VRESAGLNNPGGEPLDKNNRASGEPVMNHFLRALPVDSLKRLEPHLEPVELAPGTTILRVGTPVRRVTFINRGFVSIVKTMKDGRTVEIGTNGNHDVVGLFGLLGIEPAVWDSVVQIPGTGLRLNNEILRAEIDGNETVRRLLTRYSYQVLSHLAQTAACHRLHSLSQRFCRWLLSARDSAGTETLTLTHESLALMLGVQRSGVSIIASTFQKSGALRSNRGSITILDRGQLEAASCECYATTRRQFDQIFAAP